MTKLERLVLAVAILASFVAFLDGSVINVALPAITRELGGGLALQQWVVDAYLVTLGGLMLVAGSLADVIGRKRILLVGLVGFGIASVACALVTTGAGLVVARALQGVAGALLVPSSLALIIGTFSVERQAAAIGRWTAWTGTAYLFGPLLGGWLVDAASWRWVFGLNVLPLAVALMMVVKLPADRPKKGRVDWLGAALSVVMLGALVFALIEQPRLGWTAMVIGLLAVGVVAAGAFAWHERRTVEPMLPFELFRTRNFAVGNLATLFVYTALGTATFVIAVFVQQVGHYSALAAGLALLPVTLLMLALAERFGALAARIGVRRLMAAGPVVAAVGFAWISFVGVPILYWTQVLPGVLVFGVGLAMTVAPLTTAVLGSMPPRHAGVASAVNNAVARIAGLVGVAMLGLITGPSLNVGSFHRTMLVMAGLLVIGGLISAWGIQDAVTQRAARQP